MRAAEKTLFRVLACFVYLSSDVGVILRAYFFSYEYPTSTYVFKERAHGTYMFLMPDGEAGGIKQYDNHKPPLQCLGADIPLTYVTYRRALSRCNNEGTN